jgi:hypothetical protein
VACGIGAGGVIAIFPVGVGRVGVIVGLITGVLGMLGGACLPLEVLPCSSQSPSSCPWPITIALLGGVALGGTYSGVLSRNGEKVEPVLVGMSCSNDCRILDREVSSEGNDASKGSCLDVGAGADCLIDGAGEGENGWLSGGFWVD